MEAKYCKNCKRIIGIGCACGLSFREKNLGIDKNSLTSDDQQWRDYDRLTGQDERRREWGRSKLRDSSNKSK